jgi:hypothetical protein
VQSPPADVDAFTEAVFEAEGVDTLSNPELRRKVRAVVDRHMSRWPRAGDASTMMSRLAEVIDSHRWGDLPGLLHEDFVCRYVHTGETFDRASWVRLNAEYPGFDHLVLADCIGTEDRAAGRSHVTGYSDGKLQHFEVATFITLREGLIADMTEVWTDVDEKAPAGTRPDEPDWHTDVI